jgi:hypothetical protein
MALRDARADSRIAPLVGKLVRLKVTGSGFEISEAPSEEAAAFWSQQSAGQPVLLPRLDLAWRGPQPLSEHDLNSLPIIGAKAAQLAQLSKITSERTKCAGPVRTPSDAFAVPVVHSREHTAASGAQKLLDSLLSNADFSSNPITRAAGLERVRTLISQHPVDTVLLSEMEEAIKSRFVTSNPVTSNPVTSLLYASPPPRCCHHRHCRRHKPQTLQPTHH